MPQDRETVYYFNLREIPPRTDKANTLQIALQTRIKLFYRPQAIAPSQQDLANPWQEKLTLTRQGDRYQVNNPTPYYVSLVDARSSKDGKTVAAMDVLAPGIGEIIGGSQREERLDVLDRRLIEGHLDPAHYGWYRDLRRYGTVPHAGFGLGFERTVSYITGLSNVRDVIPFPRTPGNARY